MYSHVFVDVSPTSSTRRWRLWSTYVHHYEDRSSYFVELCNVILSVNDVELVCVFICRSVCMLLSQVLCVIIVSIMYLVYFSIIKKLLLRVILFRVMHTTRLVLYRVPVYRDLKKNTFVDGFP